MYLEKGDSRATLLNYNSSFPICSWFKFCSFWKENYPKLRVGFTTEDVCTMCHVFHNKMKYALKEKEDADRRASAALSNSDDGNYNVSTDDKFNNNTNSNDDDDEIVDDSNNDQPPGVFLEIHPRAAEEQERLEDYIGQFNDFVHNAGIHVRQAADQRVFCNEKINEAVVDASNII